MTERERERHARERRKRRESSIYSRFTLIFSLRCSSLSLFFTLHFTSHRRRQRRIQSHTDSSRPCLRAQSIRISPMTFTRRARWTSSWTINRSPIRSMATPTVNQGRYRRPDLFLHSLSLACFEDMRSFSISTTNA